MLRHASASSPCSRRCLLAGCDLLGIEPASAVAARKEAEGKAVGGACRHAGRAIEDCYALNKRADKAAVFAGWREMNDYMRENKIEAVAPQAAPAPAVTSANAEETAGQKQKSETNRAKLQSDSAAARMAPSFACHRTRVALRVTHGAGGRHAVAFDPVSS